MYKLSSATFHKINEMRVRFPELSPVLTQILKQASRSFQAQARSRSFTEYDGLARVRFFEGLTKRAPGSFGNNVSNGLAKAREAISKYAEKYPEVPFRPSDAWFRVENSGFITPLKNGIESRLRRGRDIEPDRFGDFIFTFLSELTLYGFNQVVKKDAETGKKNLVLKDPGFSIVGRMQKEHKSLIISGAWLPDGAPSVFVSRAILGGGGKRSWFDSFKERFKLKEMGQIRVREPEGGRRWVGEYGVAPLRDLGGDEKRTQLETLEKLESGSGESVWGPSLKGPSKKEKEEMLFNRVRSIGIDLLERLSRRNVTNGSTFEELLDIIESLPFRETGGRSKKFLERYLREYRESGKTGITTWGEREKLAELVWQKNSGDSWAQKVSWADPNKRKARIKGDLIVLSHLFWERYRERSPLVDSIKKRNKRAWQAIEYFLQTSASFAQARHKSMADVQSRTFPSSRPPSGAAGPAIQYYRGGQPTEAFQERFPATSYQGLVRTRVAPGITVPSRSPYGLPQSMENIQRRMHPINRPPSGVARPAIQQPRGGQPTEAPRESFPGTSYQGLVKTRMTPGGTVPSRSPYGLPRPRWASKNARRKLLRFAFYNPQYRERLIPLLLQAYMV